ncbi:Mediator of RNA polymerase II transcription subunit 33B [Frankliniella fusca]|uniref:Mediator of RNA polymerase II transcription subunit 33B n=1 Tax=Frankliniella fusca TaxID=407009 RepID=A0AAE1HGB7_9NEOP|nr:Mediator of RNA polymerase II transcription subunit 33B [Frankliniella fusca]
MPCSFPLVDSSLKPTGFPCSDSSCAMSHQPRQRPSHARAGLRDVLRKEIASAHLALEAVKCGKQFDGQMPYVNRAAHVLTVAAGKVSLLVNCSTVSGDDKTLDAELSLQGSFKEKDLLTRLALYFLVTRGRFSKVLQKTTDPLSLDSFLRNSKWFEMKREKREFLEQNDQICKATSVRYVYCSHNVEWSAHILQVVAPRVEEITVHDVGIVHLQILESMPRLRRLEIQGASSDFLWNDLGPFNWNDEGRFNFQDNDPQDTTRPFWLKELSSASSTHLVSLTVSLPRHLLLPLIVQQRRTLRELTLDVEIPETCADDLYDWQKKWPCYCYDLPQRLTELLERFSLPALRLVKLYRTHSINEEAHAYCFKQLRAVRKVLGPKVTVICVRCG